MPALRVWTIEDDCKLRDMRASGATWREIATDLGMSLYTAQQRGKRLGIDTGRLTIAVPVVCSRDPTALPAGHPITWSIICADPYPARV